MPKVTRRESKRAIAVASKDLKEIKDGGALVESWAF
jgi:hypothetical protein